MISPQSPVFVLFFFFSSSPSRNRLAGERKLPLFSLSSPIIYSTFSVCLFKPQTWSLVFSLSHATEHLEKQTLDFLCSFLSLKKRSLYSFIREGRRRKMACSKVLMALMLVLVIGSAVAQAPGASPVAPPTRSPAPVASPPTAVTTPTPAPSATVTPPTSAPPASSPTAASPRSSPPAPPTAPASSPSIAAAPGAGSPASTPGAESPASTPGSGAALNRVALAGSAGVAFFAAALLF